jgi:hypothetical protein
MRPQGVSASGQKKGIFGLVRAKTRRQQRDRGVACGDCSRNRLRTLGRMPAEPIGVKSLQEKKLRLRFPIEARYPEGFYHDFVIDT